MNKSKIILIASLVIVAVGVGGFLLYQNFGGNIAKLKVENLQKIAEQIKKEVSAPAPLWAGGNENETVFFASKIVAETNLQRQQNSLPALNQNAKLAAAALAKANDMFNKQYFEHNSPSGVTPGQLVQNYGYEYIASGENLILGNFKSEAEMVQMWMDSPGHRANILNNRYSEIGVAIVKGVYQGQWVWIGVQEFGLPLSACPGPDEALKSKIQTNQATIDSMSSQLTTIREQITDSKKNRQDDSLINSYNKLVESYNDLVNSTKELINQYNGQVNKFNQCVNG